MMRRPRHPSSDDEPEGRPGTEDEYADELAEEVAEAERFRRWFVCPVVGCDHLIEDDARDKTPRICPSDQHPSTKLKVLFNGRLMNL